jgi:hypothetical protein
MAAPQAVLSTRLTFFSKIGDPQYWPRSAFPGELLGSGMTWICFGGTPQALLAQRYLGK